MLYWQTSEDIKPICVILPMGLVERPVKNTLCHCQCQCHHQLPCLLGAGFLPNSLRACFAPNKLESQKGLVLKTQGFSFNSFCLSSTFWIGKVNWLLPTTCWAPVQSNTVSTKCQQLSTIIS